MLFTVHWHSTSQHYALTRANHFLSAFNTLLKMFNVTFVFLWGNDPLSHSYFGKSATLFATRYQCVIRLFITQQQQHSMIYVAAQDRFSTRRERQYILETPSSAPNTPDPTHPLISKPLLCGRECIRRGKSRNAQERVNPGLGLRAQVLERICFHHISIDGYLISD